MKNQILAITALAITLYSCNSTPKYVINGEVQGLSGTIYLMVEEQKIDSAEVTEGKFKMEGSVAEPDYACLATKGARSNGFFIENTPITIVGSSADLAKIVASGSRANDAMTEFRVIQQNIIAQYNSPTTTDEQARILYQQLQDNIKAMMDSNMTNVVGAFIFNDMTPNMTPEQIEEGAAKFTAEMQQSKFIKTALSKAVLAKKTAIGQPYIDFEMSDAEGVIQKFSSFTGEGKYVLLDFWASWCSPCIGEAPALIDAYRQYHSKGFEIYGVSLDKDAQAWQMAIKNNNMNWIQTSTLDGWNNSVAQEYCVRSIPANFLISPEGIIIAKNLRGDELAAKLREVIK